MTLHQPVITSSILREAHEMNLRTIGKSTRRREPIPRRKTLMHLCQAPLHVRWTRGHQPAVRRVDRDVRIREVDRRSAGQAHTPRPHHRNERRQLPSQTERQTCFRITFEPPLNTSAPDIFPQQLARTFMLNNNSQVVQLLAAAVVHRCVVAPPLTDSRATYVVLGGPNAG